MEVKDSVYRRFIDIISMFFIVQLTVVNGQKCVESDVPFAFIKGSFFIAKRAPIQYLFYLIDSYFSDL